MMCCNLDTFPSMNSQPLVHNSGCVCCYGFERVLAVFMKQCPKGVVCPCPGAIYIYMTIKVLNRDIRFVTGITFLKLGA